MRNNNSRAVVDTKIDQRKRAQQRAVEGRTQTKENDDDGDDGDGARLGLVPYIKSQRR